MTDTDARAERLARMSALGVALSELAGQLKRTYSNYAFIEPDEEAVFTELWNGLTDVEHVLTNYCHDMPDAAEAHFVDVTGFVRIPMISGEEMAAGYDYRKYPWHYARRLRKIKDKHFILKRLDGTTPAEGSPKLTAVKSLIKKPVEVPEGITVDYETFSPEGWKFDFFADGVLAASVDTRDSERFACEALGIQKARLVTAADDALAPEIPANSVIILDEDVVSYDGTGYYAFEKPNGRLDIAELKTDPEGGFIYTSYKTSPEKLDDLSAVKFLGKFRYILERNCASEEQPKGDFSDLDED